MQTILGSGGAVGNTLAKVLSEYTSEIKLVSRAPKKVNDTDVIITADLTDEEEVMAAVKGSEVVYLTVGLPYDTKLWEEKWPVIMGNVIRACLIYESKLVFFDNVYLYDRTDLDPITEDKKIKPCSKKGKIRAKVAKMLWKAMKDDGLTALIARSADFYGPGIQKNAGILREMVVRPLSKGHKANLFASDKHRHSYTYVPDAAKGMAILGNTPSAYGEVWHLPTADNPPTGKEWVELVAKELEVKPEYRVITKMAAQLYGVIVPVIKEAIEMFYLYNRDYVFDSSRFEETFSFKPTPYQEGIAELVKIERSIKLV